MSTRVWYEFTLRTERMVRRRTYIGFWKRGMWRFQGVGSFATLPEAEQALRDREVR